jgi:hypothetical protein
MYDEIMNRPMFQTPQQRQGAGIMAGVAPVRGYADGDLVSDDFFSIEQTEEGSGMNLRDLTDLFFDPEDPVDYATIGLIAFPPAYIAARLAKMGVKGAKAAEQVQKVVKMQEAIPSKVGGGSSGAKSGLQLQLSTIPAALMGEEEAMAAPSQGKMSREQADATVQEMFRPKGIEEILRQEPPTEMAIGGIVDAGKALFRSLMSKARKGEDVTDEVSDAVTRGPKEGGLSVEESDAIMGASMDSLVPTPKADVARTAGSKIDDVVDVPTPPAPPSIAKRIAKGVGIPAGIVGGVYGLGQLTGDDEEAPAATAAAGGKPQLTAQQKAQQAAAQGPAPMGIPGPNAPVFYDAETGEFKEKATGLKKFMFGEDGVGGEQAGFAGNVLAKLQDPRMQYALAKAAQPSEGFVPRNFFSDVAEGQAEYDIQQAQLKKLESESKSDLMQQFEAIRPYAQADEGETEEDVDRKVFKSLFDQLDAATSLEALLTLYKTLPSAQVANTTLDEFAAQVGLGSVSRLLTKREDTI